MPLEWPAEVNAFEAKAYLKQKGEEYRLLSETEFRYLTELQFNDEEPAISDQYNLKTKFFSPSPVGMMDQENAKIKDLYGNVWDWLSDDFYPLEGFKAHKDYTDFSASYFDEYHRMLLGGSWASCGTGASKHYRSWFRDYFFQHAGFRIAKSL